MSENENKWPKVEVQFLKGDRVYVTIDEAKSLFQNKSVILVLTGNIIRGNDFEVDNLIDEERQEITGG